MHAMEIYPKRVATRFLLKYNIRPVGPYVQLGTIFRVSMKW